jgi:hypothetical protein
VIILSIPFYYNNVNFFLLFVQKSKYEWFVRFKVLFFVYYNRWLCICLLIGMAFAIIWISLFRHGFWRT